MVLIMVEKMQDALYIVVSVIQVIVEMISVTMAIGVDRKFDTRAELRESVSQKVTR